MKKDISNHSKANAINRIDLRQVEDLCDELTGNNGDELDFGDDLYNYVFSDDLLESDHLLDSLAAPQSTGVASILEYLDGRRQEVPWTLLFEPSQDELTLVLSDKEDPLVISLEQLSCIRLARMSGNFPRNRDADCHVEIIETIDGNFYHEYIHPVQNCRNVLFGFSTKMDTRFKYTLIPLQNIKKRYQRRYLGQILLERKLITSDLLNQILLEQNELKKIKLGQILAKQAKILDSVVESEIQKAYEKNSRGLKIGEILLRAGLVNEKQIEEALKYQNRFRNKKLGSFLIEKGILQERDVYVALAEKFRLPFIDLRKQKVSRKIISLLPPQLIRKLNVLPLDVKNDTMVLATFLPDPAPVCEVILKYSPLRELEFVLVQPSHLSNVIRVLFPRK